MQGHCNAAICSVIAFVSPKIQILVALFFVQVHAPPRCIQSDIFVPSSFSHAIDVSTWCNNKKSFGTSPVIISTLCAKLSRQMCFSRGVRRDRCGIICQNAHNFSQFLRIFRCAHQVATFLCTRITASPSSFVLEAPFSPIFRGRSDANIGFF